MKWLPEKQPDPFNPRTMSVISAECFHCRRRTYFVTLMAQEAEAKYWQERFQDLLSRLNTSIEGCHRIYGIDPMTKYMLDRLVELRDGLGLGEGEEWKRKVKPEGDAP